MKKYFFYTDDVWSNLILRIFLGVVMFPHGAQKLLGWFGGNGFSGTMGYFTGKMHIPVILAFIIIMVEFFGSLGLIVGFFTRIAAFGVLCNMIGAIAIVHWQYGFFMNWSGKQAGQGFEFHLLAIAISLALIIAGAGKWSIDRSLSSE